MNVLVIFLIVLSLAKSDQGADHNKKIHEENAATKFESQHEIEVKSKDLPIHAISTYDATQSFIYQKTGQTQAKSPQLIPKGPSTIANIISTSPSLQSGSLQTDINKQKFLETVNNIDKKITWKISEEVSKQPSTKQPIKVHQGDIDGNKDKQAGLLGSESRCYLINDSIGYTIIALILIYFIFIRTKKNKKTNFKKLKEMFELTESAQIIRSNQLSEQDELFDLNK